MIEERDATTDAPATRQQPSDAPGEAVREGEIVSRPKPDPTRFGDWEKNGRCIDF